MKSSVLNNEAARLDALRQYQILDTFAEEAFDDLVMLAAQLCDTPIALINLIDENRQWFKAKVGLDIEQLPRSMGFCPDCMEIGDTLIVPDTLLDERFAQYSVVTSEPFVRFYAGVPLKTDEGYIIGTLCVVDNVPREITQKQVKGLQSLARLAMRQLDIRRNVHQLAVIQKDYKQAKQDLHHSEHVLRSFFNSAAMMMGIVELHGDDIIHISGNKASANFHGFTLEAMENRFASDLGISKERLDDWIKHYRQAEQTQAPVSFEYQFNKPDKQGWLRATVNTIACCDSHIHNRRFAYIVEDITKSKKIEQEREKLLKIEQSALNQITSIFESITDGFFALDNNWCFTYLNKQTEPLLQRNREELLGKNVWEEFPEAIGSRFYHEYYRAIKEQVSVEFEEFYPPLGKWYAVHAYPAKNGLSVYFQDISKRRHAEEDLNCQQAILRSINNVSPLGFYVVEKCSGHIYYYNHRFCEIWGLENLQAKLASGELKNRDVLAQCQQQVIDIQGFIARDKSIHNTKNTGVSEDEIALKDGRIIRRISTEFRQEGECCFGRLYIFEDITDRKSTEQKIRERSTLLDITTDAIIVRDLSSRILLWNKSAEKLYGWQEKEVVGRNAQELFYANQSHNQYQHVYDTVLEKGSWQGELIKYTKSGQEILVESTWNLVFDEDLQAKSILTVETDITHKKQLETQFLRAQRMESIGTLSSGIAHDLNNVLSPILMSVQLLKSKCQDERDSQMLAIVENNAKRGANLVKQVLSFARGIEGNRTVITIDNLIQEIQQIVEQTFPKSIQFSAHIQQNLLAIYGDITQLHQALINLCLNARDAMPEGGLLKIKAENVVIDENYASMHLEAQAGAYILLTITDTGVGISNELLDRIFEPFFTTKEFGKGTGLGLSNVMAIIKGHGGFISVSSSVGKGTQFKVYLPAVNGEAISPVEDAEIPQGCGELILVVDDEASIREITKTSLENYGYQVITASDGIEAVAIFAQQKTQIKAAIVDMMMPNMDGSKTIVALQRLNPLLPVIIVSGLLNSEQIPIVKESNQLIYLPKPFTAQELLKTLDKLLALAC